MAESVIFEKGRALKLIQKCSPVPGRYFGTWRIFLSLLGLNAAFNPVRAEEEIRMLTTERPVVVELFTSEGCSSCPPADQYVKDLKKRRDLLPLSFHVDYWDYIGWKDRFADPAYTKRQRYYANVFGSHTVYTPQMVIGGALDAVGSDRASVSQALDNAKANLVTYDIGIEKQGAELIARFPESPINGSATIWYIGYQQEGASNASAGENAGRKLESHNIVRKMMKLGEWDGQKTDIVLPTLADRASDIDGVAIIVNLDQTGQVVAAIAFAPL